MKIGIDVTASIYTGTGVGMYYQLLIPELLRIGASHQFVLFGYALRRYRDLTLANRRFPFPPRLMEFLWNQLHIVPIEQLIGEIDVFHAWDYLQPPVKRAKVVTTIHDLTAIKFPMYHHPSTVSAQKRRLQWARKEAALLIADSKATKRDLVELLDIDEKKISVIPLAAGKQFAEFRRRSQEFKQSEIERVQKKYGISGPYLLSLGTMEPRKNLKRVVEAFQRPRLHGAVKALVVAGQVGWGEQLIPSPGVALIGKVPQEDTAPLFAGAQALVYASLYEGFGLPVLEAMAVGCPVVTSDKGSLKEVAGTAAVLVNPEDVDGITHGIEIALEKRNILINRGIKQESKFSWQRTAQETLRAYREASLS